MSKGEEHQKQHYVPQCYLNYFGYHKRKKNSKEFFLYAYDVKRNIQKHTSVEDACQLPYFYKIPENFITDKAAVNTLSLEVDILAKEIESKYGILLKELFTRKEKCIAETASYFPIYDDEKAIFAKQIAIQYYRLPWQRERIVSFAHQFYDKTIEITKHLVAKVENNPSLSQQKLNLQFNDALIHAETLFLNDTSLDEISQHLCSMNWLFGYAPQKNICTSDNPIVIYNPMLGCPMTLNKKGIVVNFPLFPDLLLIISDYKEHSFMNNLFMEISDFSHEAFHNFLSCQSTEIYNYNNDFEYIKNFIHGKNENAKS